MTSIDSRGAEPEALTAPRDDRGRFFTRRCPVCDCGTLQIDRPATSDFRRAEWACDGLLDPNDPRAELQPCYYTHIDGERPGP